jgi:hypothetical protein
VSWAAKNGFSPCYTVDTIDREPRGSFAQAIAEEKIYRIVDDSTIALKRILTDQVKPQPFIFWLDAHGPKSVGSPVLEEIETILKWNHQAFIFIDDITIFARERFYTKKYDTWPKVEEIYKALGTRPYCARADALISFPEELVSEMWHCWEAANNVDWFIDLPGSGLRLPTEGWFMPWRARKYHYIFKGQSMCKDYKKVDLIPKMVPAHILGKQRCKRCLKKL